MDDDGDWKDIPKEEVDSTDHSDNWWLINPFSLPWWDSFNGKNSGGIQDGHGRFEWTDQHFQLRFRYVAQTGILYFFTEITNEFEPTEKGIAESLDR